METIQDIRSTPPTGMPPREPLPPTHSSHKGAWTSIIIVALLIIVGVWVWKTGSGVTTEDGGSVTTASQGELVRTFPASLLLNGGDGMDIESSYMISYRDRGEQLPVVDYLSEESFESTVTQFRQLLKREEWVIMRDGVETETPVTNFYAEKEAGRLRVNITVEERESGVRVVIAYSELEEAPPAFDEEAEFAPPAETTPEPAPESATI